MAQNADNAGSLVRFLYGDSQHYCDPHWSLSEVKTDYHKVGEKAVYIG
jgi:hypothetical protein